MSNIFDSDSDVEIRTNNEYAKNYDTWRKKEEINKLKTKYGDDINFEEDSSDSSSDDEEGVELTEEIEQDFFKTLSCLKNKDPRIYNENVTFFQQKDDTSKEKKNKKKEAPMNLKDYERKIILEKDGMLSDDEDESGNITKSATYVKEQHHIKESLKNAVSAVDDNEDHDEWMQLCKEKNNSQKDVEKKDADYKKWLAGEKKEIDEQVEHELKPLKDYWNNPNLDEGEKFLRDYILNKKFLDKNDDDYNATYDEVIHDSDQDLSNDENTIDKQEEFEHKYNFRFEEPDQEFIKRYPRTLENSVRKKDDRRKVKRQETKERKKKEKEEKMKELKKLQELKRKEIEEKLEKLKEITGNSDIGFQNDDIDGDFDPEEHDKRMEALFNNDFYQGPEEDQKPVFPELDEELEIERWDRYENENEAETDTPHCEDEDFNMDCDYVPNAATQKELIETTKGKKKRKRKSKVAEALSKPKPKFDPNDKDYEQYFDEYYKLDCEDIIGDIPCRFKYRTVAPNDFGLTIEEILLAKDRELNKWCSLKKALQIRPDHVEKYDQIAYRKKAQNINLKKKILPSLFSPDPEEENDLNKSKDVPSTVTSQTREKKQSKKESNISSPPKDGITVDGKGSDEIPDTEVKKELNPSESVTTDSQAVSVKSKSKRKAKKKADKSNKPIQNQKQQRKRKVSGNEHGSVEAPRKKVKKNEKKNKHKEIDISDARLSAYGINPKKFKNKLKFGNK